MKTLLWPYKHEEVMRTKAGSEPITNKQIAYILSMSKQKKDNNTELNSILDSIPGDLNLEDLSKGQGMYVIKCQRGEIVPYMYSG